MTFCMALRDPAKRCEDCAMIGAQWCCTMNCSTAEFTSGKDLEITEDWLASVGFKYREPGERQPFRHWTLQFDEADDYGLYIETTMPGLINDAGEHIGADRGWFLWIGRSDRFFLHLRHMFRQAEIVALVEAIAGQPWVPDRTGRVPVKRRQQPGEGRGC